MGFLSNEAGKRWPSKRIRYTIDGRAFSPGSPARTSILQAVEKITESTNVEMVELRYKESCRDSLYFTSSKLRCLTYTGRVGGKQSVYLDTTRFSVKNIIHEILHALGFYHEHTRQDRDEHIRVLESNISSPSLLSFFRKKNQGEGTQIGDYDSKSIMHYSSREFNKDEQKTIKSELGLNDELGGDKLSALDISAVNSIFPLDLETEDKDLPPLTPYISSHCNG